MDENQEELLIEICEKEVDGEIIQGICDDDVIAPYLTADDNAMTPAVLIAGAVLVVGVVLALLWLRRAKRRKAEGVS